jgi:DNA polymerase III subunit epsilon
MRLTRDLVFFDLETTGTDPAQDRVVSMAAVRLRPDGSRAEWHGRYNPGRPIPRLATAVHGITDADVAPCSPFASAARELFAALSGCDLAGYNVAAYDVPLLAAEFRRCGLAWPAPDQRIADAFQVFRAQEPHNLAGALRRYKGQRLDGAHDALVDTMATVEVLLAQAEHYGAADLEQLLALQRADDWADSTGKVKRVGDIPVLNFGKWSGTPLDQVPADYRRWMLGADFPDDTKELLRASLAGGAR